MQSDGASADWVVLRNRLQHIEANNMRRVGRALDELSKRVVEVARDDVAITVHQCGDISRSVTVIVSRSLKIGARS